MLNGAQHDRGERRYVFFKISKGEQSISHIDL